jgi:tripartite-type tricarboxylate transporter receptor subunit TctC
VPTAGAAAAASATGFDERAVADFYRGKTVRIVVGSAPGGTYDTYSRILARHMPKHLPGNPTMIVENKPGAGSMLAANALYNTEAKDGTVVGTFNETLIMQQALGAPGVQYDARRLQWIGSAVNTAMTCAARTDAGISGMPDLLEGKPLVFGTMPPGSSPYDTPAVINEALGLNWKLVSGYDGVSRIVLAVESKEVDALCLSLLSLTTVAPQLFQGDPPTARVFAIMGERVPSHPLLGSAVAVEPLAKTDEARQLLQAMHAPAQVTNPYAVAPEVPRDRVEALRKAFWDAFQDPQLLAEAQQVGTAFSPTPGYQVERVADSVLNTPAPIVARLKDILVK